MDAIKQAGESVKEVLGGGADKGHADTAAASSTGTAHKTAPQQTTGTGVVGSLEEAGHRMMEKQGADNPGYYDAQAGFEKALKGHHDDKKSGREMH